MAGDARGPAATRRRQTSNAGGGSGRALPVHQQSRQQQQQPPQPRSAHVADAFLQDFLSPGFDAAEYWNASLPTLQVSGGGSSSGGGGGGGPASRAGGQKRAAALPLAELSAEAQAMLSQLGAHTTRLTNTLTQLTDDMLRGGSRLAYEVELLRGETLSLAEALTEGLHDDVARFVPGGIAREGAGAEDHPSSEPPLASRRVSLAATPTAAAAPAPAAEAEAAAEAAAVDEPPYIAQLRTLSLVRARLDSVIRAFGDAMEFVFPPSELSVSSSFLSVSAPDPGAEMHSTEEKGQQVLQGLRDELGRLLSRDAADPIGGVEDAARRIEQLKDLAVVWRGTAEEKGRTRFIESLAKMVEDRHRELLRELEQQQQQQQQQQSRARPPEADDSIPRRPTAAAEASAPDARGYSGGYGLISQLQKIRGGL